MSFFDKLQTTKQVGDKYKCQCCKRQLFGIPWMSYHKHTNTLHLCRYLCYKQERERDDTIWENLLNKSDYEFITPIRKTKISEFIFLNDTELNRLTESEYIQYNYNLEEYYWKNPERAKIREREINEENYLISL